MYVHIYIWATTTLYIVPFGQQAATAPFPASDLFMDLINVVMDGGGMNQLPVQVWGFDSKW